MLGSIPANCIGQSDAAHRFPLTLLRRYATMLAGWLGRFALLWRQTEMPVMRVSATVISQDTQFRPGPTVQSGAVADGHEDMTSCLFYC
jgi:hypothetical protein